MNLVILLIVLILYFAYHQGKLERRIILLEGQKRTFQKRAKRKTPSALKTSTTREEGPVHD